MTQRWSSGFIVAAASFKSPPPPPTPPSSPVPHPFIGPSSRERKKINALDLKLNKNPVNAKCILITTAVACFKGNTRYRCCP